MCFSVSITKEAFERDPRFHYLIDEDWDEGFHQMALQFPKLPLLTEPSQSSPILARWGLIPSWVTNLKKARDIRYNTVNARGETLEIKPSFKDCWPHQRCVIPVEGFFEIHRSSEGEKIPWYITRKDRALIFLGGIYQKTPEKTAELGEMTFSIITMAASGLLAEIHNEKLRMPLMMTEVLAEKWLAPSTDGGDLLDIRWCLNQNDLEAWPVDGALFKSGKNDPRVRDQTQIWEQGELF